MKRKDMREAIASAIAGQENQVDLSGLLAEILNSLVGVEVEDITAISADVLDSLECGDIVVKKTGNQRHAYLVSYKGDGAGEGICLSYNAAGYGETVSYDRTDDGWAYNSTDVKTYGAEEETQS